MSGSPAPYFLTIPQVPVLRAIPLPQRPELQGGDHIMIATQAYLRSATTTTWMPRCRFLVSGPQGAAGGRGLGDPQIPHYPRDYTGPALPDQATASENCSTQDAATWGGACGVTGSRLGLGFEVCGLCWGRQRASEVRAWIWGPGSGGGHSVSQGTLRAGREDNSKFCPQT